MDDRERLLALCKEHGIEIHHKSGLAKLQQALLDAGIEFELVDTEPPQEAPPAPKSGMVEVMVMSKSLHIMPKDMGEQGDLSKKFYFKDRLKLKRDLAESLMARGQVEIL